MARDIIKIVALICVVGLFAGCTAKVYRQERMRVDQEITGNAGCLYGTCPERGEYSKTRQTFVLEIETRPSDIPEEDRYIDEPQETPLPETSDARSPRVQRPETPQVIIHQPKETVPAYTDYQVQEGDTLQKISKKFYDTYRRWHEIYEANQDVLTNPDRIRPGITIRIPPK